MSDTVKAVIGTLVVVAVANALVLLYIRSQGQILAVVPAESSRQTGA